MLAIKTAIQTASVLAFLFMSFSAWAAQIQDVQVLDVQTTSGLVKAKLRAKGLPQDSCFFLYIEKQDPAAFEKLGAIINKLNRPDDFRLDLNILDFSPLPSGSAYRSKGVTVESIALTRQPNSQGHRKIKK